MKAARWVMAALVAAALGAAVLWFVPRSSSPKGAALAGRERAMQLLGAQIAQARPDCKVLVVGNPFTKNSSILGPSRQYERTGLRGLRAGLGHRARAEEVFPELLPEYVVNPESIPVPADCRTPLSFVIRPASLDELAEGHPECPVIVSLIGLPVGVEQLKVWSENDPRCFALLLPDFRLLGPPAAVVAAFARGKLLAAVVEDPRSGTPLIVTRENIAEILAREPSLLGY